jgi:hypothetical protein
MRWYDHKTHYNLIGKKASKCLVEEDCEFVQQFIFQYVMLFSTISHIWNRDKLVFVLQTVNSNHSVGGRR